MTTPTEREFESFLTDFGLSVKKARTAQGKTQEWMDDKQDYGIDIKHYQSIEQGRANVTLKTIFKICRKLKIPPSALFEDLK